MGSIGRKTHKALPRHTTNSEHTIGQWMHIQGKFKMQAHMPSGVVMDIAAFKVSHSGDTNATAL